MNLQSHSSCSPVCFGTKKKRVGFPLLKEHYGCDTLVSQRSPRWFLEPHPVPFPPSPIWMVEWPRVTWESLQSSGLLRCNCVQCPPPGGETRASHPRPESLRIKDKAYRACGQAVSALHAMVLLQVYQANALVDMAKDAIELDPPADMKSGYYSFTGGGLRLRPVFDLSTVCIQGSDISVQSSILRALPVALHLLPRSQRRPLFPSGNVVFAFPTTSMTGSF